MGMREILGICRRMRVRMKRMCACLGLTVVFFSCADHQKVMPTTEDACVESSEELGSSINVKSDSEQIYIGQYTDPRFPLTTSEREALAQAGCTQCVMPFGILIAADSRMPKEYVRTAGAVLAEILDQDMNGEPDDAKLVEVLRNRKRAWLAMPMDEDNWEYSQRPILNRVFGYDIIIPSWWLDVSGPVPDARARAVIVEEVHHFVTQFGYSVVYPETFGVDDWDSVLGQETLRAQCVFWQHPENDCPGSPSIVGGDCEEPNCDAVEFLQQVVVLRAGMTPGWFGIGFPSDSNILEELLSTEFKAVLDNSRYHQLAKPLTMVYPISD